MMIPAIPLLDPTKLIKDTGAEDKLKPQEDKMYYIESRLISRSNNEIRIIDATNISCHYHII